MQVDTKSFSIHPKFTKMTMQTTTKPKNYQPSDKIDKKSDSEPTDQANGPEEASLEDRAMESD